MAETATAQPVGTPDAHGTAAHGTAAHGAHATSTGLSNVKLGMWLFLGSDCLLFGGLISTYML
ncbi:MAG: hypothetical protein ACKOIZ_03505, partial [Actinomycetota bacterium]